MAYNKHMEFVRRVVLVIITPLFVVLLFSTASNTSVLTVATNPDKIKTIITNSGVYETVVPGLLDEAKAITSAGEQVSLADDIVREAAAKTFSPSFVKTNTETVIDSIYAWLDGKTPLPDFQIDLTAAKASFAANVADAVEAKLAGLPTCTSSAGVPDNFDPLAATCLPPGMDPVSEASSIEQDIISGTGFIDHPVITADTLKGEGDAKSLFTDQFKEVPEIYQKVKAAPFVMGALAILLMLAIILLSSSKRKGLRRVGVTLLLVGLIITGIAYGLNRGIDYATKQISLENAVLEDKSKILLTEIVQEMDKTYWMFGIGYAVLGAIAIGGAIYLGRRNGGGDDDDLEGEGKSPEDRIDLREGDKPTPLAQEKEERPKPTEFESPRGGTTAGKPKPKSAAKPAAKKTPKKIQIQ